MKQLERLRFAREEDGSVCIFSGRYDEFGEPVSECRVLSIATAQTLHRELSVLLGVALTPEPSADVVEKSRTWLEWRYQEYCRGDDKFVRLSDVQAIIEAEVQRRMAQPATKPQQHDPDDWPEPGMEEKR